MLSVFLFFYKNKDKNIKGGVKMGRILLIEFQKEDATAFDEVMTVLKRYPNFETLCLNNETVISLPGLTIYPEQRKIYRDRQEIHLTTKEYEILCLLVSNRGQILTYAQIYEKVWGAISSGSENKAIRYHIYRLREKLYAVSPDEPFSIRCVREIGYCFELKPIKPT